MYLESIQKIESIQCNRISEIDIHSNGNTKIKGPPKGCAGVYFFIPHTLLKSYAQAKKLLPCLQFR